MNKRPPSFNYGMNKAWGEKGRDSLHAYHRMMILTTLHWKIPLWGYWGLISMYTETTNVADATCL